MRSTHPENSRLLSELLCAVAVTMLSTLANAAPKPAADHGPYYGMSPMGRLAQQAANGKGNHFGIQKHNATVTKDFPPNGDDGEGDGPAGGQAEVSVAVDPTGMHVVVGYNDTRGFSLNPYSVSGFAYSDDGGVTFTDGGQLPARGNPNLNGNTQYPQIFGDPDIKYVPGGNGLQFIYASIMVKAIGASTAQTLCIFTSTNAGHSWQGPYEITPGTNPTSTSDAADKEFIDVDPDTGRVIVSWSNFAGTGGVQISTSYCDNIMTGNPPTWSARSVLNSGGNNFDTGSIPRFAGNGSNEVYVAWSRTSNTSLTSYGHWGNTRIAFARSTDNGVTWSAAANVSLNTFPIDYILGNDRVHSFPWMAVDTSSGPNKGNVYLVYVDNSSKDGGDIAFQRSTNRGAAFSNPVFLSSRPGADRAQWFPVVTVDPDTGRINVMYDDQGVTSSGDLTEMTWTYSDDGGKTWSRPTPLTSRPFHGGYGNDTGQPNLGDYNGATSRGGALYAAFTTTPEIALFADGQPNAQFTYPSFLPGQNPVGFRKATSASAAMRLGPVTFTDSGGNGYLDPGETASLKIPLQNFVTNSLFAPGAFTGVSATLATTNTGVLVTTPTQVYTSIVPGAAVTNASPFLISLQPTLVPGTRIEFTLTITTDQGTATLLFPLPTGTPIASTIFSENFNSVTSGALPSGWTAVHGAASTTVPWTTSNSVPQAPDGNALFHINAQDGGSDSTRWERAFSPLVTIPSAASYATLDFDVWYNTENDIDFNVLAYDGFFLRIFDQTSGRTSRSCLAEAFADEFFTGTLQHYPKHLPRSDNASYFEDMSVWGGYSGGWQHVRMKLPGVAGSTLQLRWEYTQDPNGTGANVNPSVPLAGVAVDNIVMQSVSLMATPTLTWLAPSAITYGTALGNNQLDASASVPGTFAYTPPGGSVLTAGNHTLTVVFTPTDTVHYLSVTGSVSLAVSPATLTAVAADANRSFGQSNPSFLVTLTGVVNGDNITANASCSATSASSPGSYTIVPSLVDPGNLQTNYQISLTSGTLVVSPATVNLTWAPPSAITYGTPLASQQLNAGATVQGTYTYNPASGVVLPAGTNTLSVLFTPTDAVDYSNAVASVSLVVLDALIYGGIDLTVPAQATADSDGDGVSNLLEYALGTDPNNPADAQSGLVFSVAQDAGNQYLAIQFKRRKTSPGLPLLYLVEVSSDGQTWYSDALNVGTPVVTPLDSEFDLVSLQDLTPTTSLAPRFIRLHVTSY